ncbi:VOC family protein [Alkalinema pantanalense CENA528]|uniref:VOC family protein n=1 Tax=Alkalinema pantanalense TaxID=1620705 RepID=UPI003D6E863C
MLKITQFLHAAIVVQDLTRSEHFYGTVLGLPKVERNLKFPGVWYEIAGIQIHLMQARAEGSVPQIPGRSTPLAEKWGRNPHLAFAVIDLEAIKVTLDRAGYVYQMSSSGRPALFVQDPDGHVIELGEVQN